MEMLLFIEKHREAGYWLTLAMFPITKYLLASIVRALVGTVRIVIVRLCSIYV